MIGLRNDRQLGILNGQRGTVRHVDRDHHTVLVELDGGRRVSLDVGYLAEHLDHGYAMTAHKAQGATVDRTFVLGSQGLYRELGYTALTRHREEARFYVARGDLEPRVERDLPDHDLLIAGLEDLFARSGAKHLAHDRLADRDTAELEHDRGELRIVFEDQELPWTAEVSRLERERDQAQRDLDGCERRIELLKERRGNVGLFDFRERQELDHRLADAREVHLQQLERSQRAKHAHRVAESRLSDWFERYGSEAGRLIAVDREVTERQQLNDLAIARQEAVKRTPEWADRELPAPEIPRDVGRDLGHDLGW